MADRIGLAGLHWRRHGLQRFLLLAVLPPCEVSLPAAVASGAGSDDEARLPLLHFDFYRFNDPQEWEDAGFRELFASPGLKLVEWPEKAAGLLPPADLKLQIDFADDSANVSADPSAAR